MTCRDRECSSNGGAGFPCSSCLDEATGKTAIGQQTERSGVPNPEADGLVTVELTREEAEGFIEGGYKNDGRDYYAVIGAIRCQIRASLERTSK